MKSLVLALFLATAAQASIITQTAFLADWADPVDQWSSSVSLPFHQFDPALGTLTSVRFSTSADIGMYFPSWPTGSPDYLVMEDSLLTTLGYSYRAFTYGYSGDPSRPVDTSLKVGQSGNMIFDLDSFIGQGSWSFDAKGGVWVYLQSPWSAPLPPGVLSLKNLSVEIGYDYTPTAHAPEPRYAGFVLIGIAVVVWLLRGGVKLVFPGTQT